MNKVDETLELLIEAINDIPEIKRLHELEGFIDQNEDIKDLMSELRFFQKKYINAKYYKKNDEAILYNDKIKEVKQKMSNIPFLDEYLELLEDSYQMVNNFSKIMAEGINKELK